MKAKKNPGFHRLRTMTLHEGLAYLRAPYQERKINGFWVENKSVRLQLFKSGLTNCVSCGMKGTHFHIERHWNDFVMPFSINLYGMDGEKEVMMTWDHILPISLGGSNDIVNAQTMCTNCNSEKGNQISLKEMLEIVTHPYVVRFYKWASQPEYNTLQKIINQVQHENINLRPVLDHPMNKKLKKRRAKIIGQLCNMSRDGWRNFTMSDYWPLKTELAQIDRTLKNGENRNS